MGTWEKYVGQEGSGNDKSKRWLVALGCFVGLVAVEQAGWINLHYARAVSHSASKVAQASGARDHGFKLRVDRPVTRWLPFIKFGETVHSRTAQYHELATHTDLWVFGLCSTAKYDELANKPFEEQQKKLAKR